MSNLIKSTLFLTLLFVLTGFSVSNAQIVIDSKSLEVCEVENRDNCSTYEIDATLRLDENEGYISYEDEYSSFVYSLEIPGETDPETGFTFFNAYEGDNFVAVVMVSFANSMLIITLEEVDGVYRSYNYSIDNFWIEQ
ncbi:MAG: hypothetical protein IAE91_12155 [Ignavibacteriaceae bacterium]|nr:hypothetical protein [Ignavibacteriaceae bacterium]